MESEYPQEPDPVANTEDSAPLSEPASPTPSEPVPVIEAKLEIPPEEFPVPELAPQIPEEPAPAEAAPPAPKGPAEFKVEAAPKVPEEPAEVKVVANPFLTEDPKEVEAELKALEEPEVVEADPETPEPTPEKPVEAAPETPEKPAAMDADSLKSAEQAAEEQFRKDEEERAAKLEQMKAQFKEMPLMQSVVSDKTDIRIMGYEELTKQLKAGSGDGLFSELVDEKLVAIALDKAPNAQSIGFGVVKAFFDKASKSTAEPIAGAIVQALVTKGFSGSEIKRKHASEALVVILGNISGEHVHALMSAQAFKSNPSFMEYSAITMRKTLEKYGKDSLPLDDIIPVLPSLLINARGPKVTKPTLKLIEVILKISDTDYTPQLMKHAPTIPAVQLEKMKKLFETHGKVSYQTEYWNQFEASKVAPKLEKPKPWTESIDGSLGDGYLNAAVNDCFKILESAEKIGPTTREKLTTAIAGVFRTPRSPTIIASCAKLVIKLAEILPVGEFDNAKEIAKQLYEQFKIRMKTADEVLAEALMKLITVKHIKPKDIDSDSIALKATMKNKYKALKSPKTVLELEVKLEGKKKKKKVSTVDEKSSKKKSSGTSKSRSSKKKKDSETSEKVGKSSSKKSSKSKSSAEKTEKVSKSRSSKSSSEKVSKSKSSKSTAEKTDKVSKSKSRSDKKKSSSGDSEKKKSSSGDADKPPKTPKKKSSKSTADSDVVTSRPKTPKSSNKSKTSDSDTGISQLKTPKTPKKKSSKSSAESDIGASRPKTPKSSSKSKSSKSLKKAKSKKSEH